MFDKILNHLIILKELSFGSAKVTDEMIDTTLGLRVLYKEPI